MNRNKPRARTKVMKINVTARGSFFSFLSFRVLEKKKKKLTCGFHTKKLFARARATVV